MIHFKNERNSKTKILIENEQSIILIEDKQIDIIKSAINMCLENENIDFGCEISVTLVDNQKIKEINNEFRKVNTPTDVLSFPIVDMSDGVIISKEGDYNLDENLLLLGDIVISPERAREQAIEYNHSFEREMAFLTVHGLLHLLGYDHEMKNQELNMIEKQENILDKMGLRRL